MSKKTKKEKILAAYRKKLRLLEQSEIKPNIENKEIVTKKTAIIEKKEIEKTIKTPTPKYFFLDLRKSLFLIALIITLEIGLYFAKLIK